MSEMRYEPRIPLEIGEEYINWLVELKYENIPADVIHRAKRHILDTVACMLAGRYTLTTTGRLLDDMEPDCGPSHLMGTDKTSTMAGAAYLNGVCAQTHDFNDGLNNCGMYGGTYHPGREIIPAALSVAEAVGATGKELLTAVVAGYETAGRIRNTNWPKTPPLVDGFAVSCACAKLMGADYEQMKLAMSHGTNLAPVFNGGSDKYESNYTGWGHVCAVGVRAAMLGMKRSSAPVWNDSQSGSLRYASRGLGKDWILRDTYFKPWPACRKTHGAIACALEYVANGIKAEDIDKVKIFQQYVGMYVNNPINNVKDFDYKRYRQFSLQYTVACAFIDGTVDLRHFRGEMRPEILEFSKKISVAADNALDGHNEISPNHAAMDLYLKDGTVRSIYVQYPLGSEPNAMTDEQLGDKLRHCADGILTPEAAEKLIAYVWALDECEKVSCAVC